MLCIAMIALPLNGCLSYSLTGDPTPAGYTLVTAGELTTAALFALAKDDPKAGYGESDYSKMSYPGRFAVMLGGFAAIDALVFIAGKTGHK
jgi:hypothetical protein